VVAAPLPGAILKTISIVFGNSGIGRSTTGSTVVMRRGVRR